MCQVGSLQTCALAWFNLSSRKQCAPSKVNVHAELMLAVGVQTCWSLQYSEFAAGVVACC